MNTSLPKVEEWIVTRDKRLVLTKRNKESWNIKHRLSDKLLLKVEPCQIKLTKRPTLRRWGFLKILIMSLLGKNQEFQKRMGYLIDYMFIA